MQRALGALWLFDGLLQLKPAMFTHSFVTQVLLPNQVGQPPLLRAVVRWGAHLTAPEILVWNVCFALLQIALGLLLLLNVRARTALLASFLWVGIVWVFGEGLGQLLTGTALVVTGAPGGVLLYAVVGLIIWPGRADEATWAMRASRWSRYAVGSLWLLGGVLQFQPMFMTPTGFSSMLIPSTVLGPLTQHGDIVSAFLGTVLIMLGLLTFWQGQVAGLGVASLLLACLFWWVGQEFGQFWFATGTDPNAGPPTVFLILMSCPPLGRQLMAWFGPRRSRTDAPASPALASRE
jgi:hypothetical protein